MCFRTINYLHYGDSLLQLDHITKFLGEGNVKKRELLEYVKKNGIKSNFLQEVIRYYGQPRSRSIKLNFFLEDIKKSIQAREFFSGLGCRGFSYSYLEGIKLKGYRLKQNINLKVALMSKEELFYPLRIRRYLRHTNDIHLKVNGYSSIAFSLGIIDGDDCYILVLQSDIAYRQQSYIRDHFRGWRKILLFMIEYSVRERCKRLWLCRSNDIIRCCHPLFRPKRNFIPLWDAIYDRTAMEMGFITTRREKPIDLQVYKNLPSVFVHELYLKKIE